MARAGPVLRKHAFAVVVYAALLYPLACQRSSPTEPRDTPAWLQSLIARIEAEPVTSPPSAIYRYRYRGETVYFRPSRCCDFPSNVYDRDGAVICQPDGGLAGGGDGACPDFFQTRTDEALIWRDTRL